MAEVNKITFGFIDRLSRAFIGTAMVVLSFVYAANSEIFATMQFFAMYPIFTALVAWDPIYFLIEVLKQQWVEYTIMHR